MTAFFSSFSRLISTASSALSRSSKSGTVSCSKRLSFSYISSVVVSVIIFQNSLRYKFEADIKHLRGACQSANRNVVNTRSRNFEPSIERNVARRLEFGPSIANLNCFAHHCRRHIVEQDSFDAECERFTYIVQRTRLDLNFERCA